MVVLTTASELVAVPRVVHAVAPTVGVTYVVDTGRNAITEYAAGADGNVTPIHTISGGLTRLNVPQFLALDSAGNIYVTNGVPDSAQSDLLVEFAAGTDGNVAPTKGIWSGSAPNSLTHLNSPQGVAVDATGNIFVVNVNDNSVLEYPPMANGNTPPLRTISGPMTLLSTPIGVTLDGGGNIYVTNVGGTGSVTVYGLTVIGNMPPTRNLVGAQTGLNVPASVTLSADASTMYVVNNAGGDVTLNSVTEYPATATGNTAPARTIVGARTGLNDPVGSALDANGTLYVANVRSDNSVSSVTEYAAGATDNVAPLRTIHGGATGLSQVYGIAASGKVEAPPTLVTTAAHQSTPGGGDLTDTATLSGATTAPAAGGMITFTLFGPDDTTCSGAGVLTSSKAVTGNGSYSSDAYNAVTGGTYSWRATYSGDDNNDAAGPGACGAPSETVTVTVIPLAAALPAMSNGAYGGYVTAATIQNTGSSPADVAIAYFDQSGHVVGTGDSHAGLPAKAGWTVRQDSGHAFAAGRAGSALVYSTQPVASFVNEFAPGDAGDGTSYTGIPVPTSVVPALYAPTIVNNAYGGYTTGIGLLNQGAAPTDVTVAYRDASGATVKSQTLAALPAHAYRALYSGDPTLALPSGFAGTATITESGSQPLAAIVNEVGPGGQNSSYDAAAATALSLNVPVALNSAYGGYFTGMGVQNTSSAAGSVTITYYDTTGAATGAGHNFSIPANGSLGVYQGSATDGPPVGAYTAVISSTLPLAAIVNEVAPPGAGSARQSTSYNTFPTGSSLLNLPLVENGGPDPWNTGEGIMNTGATATTVTVTYYSAANGAAVGAPRVATLASRAFLGLYQPDPASGLPAGSRATAVVTTDSGGQVAVICNERSPTTFMSYDGQ